MTRPITKDERDRMLAAARGPVPRPAAAAQPRPAPPRALDDLNRAALRLYLDDQPTHDSQQRDHEAAARAWRDGRVPEVVKARYRAMVQSVARALVEVGTTPAAVVEARAAAAEAERLAGELAKVAADRDAAATTAEERRALIVDMRGELAALAADRDAVRAEVERLRAVLADRPAYVPATRLAGLYWYRHRKAGTVTCDTTVPAGADLMYVPVEGGDR